MSIFKFLIFLNLTIFSHQSFADDFHVSIINVEPFGMIGKEVYGIHKDYLEEVFKTAKISAKFSVSPYPRVVSDIQKGVTSAALFFKRDDLENVVEVGRSIGFKVLLVTHKKSKIDPKNLEGKTIAIIRNAKYEPKFDKNTKINKFPVKNYKQGLLMVSEQRVDGLMISGPAFGFYKSKLKGVDNNLAKPIVFNEKHNYLYANAKLEKPRIDEIRRANKKLLKSGILDKILKKYR